MSAVPTVYGALSRVPVDADIGSLRAPVVGASPLPSSVREGFARHTGVRLLEGYGLTEATCASAFTPFGGERAGSVGKVLPSQRVKAVRVGDDGSWTDCAPGEVGLLVIGGPTVFAGYVTAPRSAAPGSRARGRSATAGSTPATSAASTPTGTSTSPGVPRTSSSGAATTSTRR